MAEQFTFPQSGDADDAEHFGSMIGQDNLSNYVERGLGFTVDYGVPEVAVGTGKAFIKRDQETASSSGNTILDVSHTVQVPDQTVALTDSAVNYIYVDPKLDTSDSAEVVADTTQQSHPFLRIGTIDTSANTSSTRNRAPSVTVSELFTEGDIADGSQTIWDASAQEIPDSALGSIENATLTNSDITISTNGSGLKGGGSVSLGDSIELDVEPADFAGAFLADDGADNLEVTIGRGLEDDGTGSLQFDEDTGYTFTTQQSFSAGLSVGNDITSSGQVIWDDSASRIPTARYQGLTIEDAGTTVLSTTNINFDSNLSVVDDGDGTLTVNAASSTDTRTDISDSGIQVVSQTADINFTGDIAASDDGDGTASVTLSNNSVTVAGNSVSLGGSTGVAHSDLSGIGSSDHHSRFSDEEAQDAVGGILNSDFTYNDVDNIISLSSNSISTSFDTHLSGDASVSLGGTLNISVNDDFLFNSGDTMSGALQMHGEFNADNTAGGRVVLPVGTDQYAT